MLILATLRPALLSPLLAPLQVSLDGKCTRLDCFASYCRLNNSGSSRSACVSIRACRGRCGFASAAAADCVSVICCRRCIRCLLSSGALRARSLTMVAKLARFCLIAFVAVRHRLGELRGQRDCGDEIGALPHYSLK